MPAVHDVGDAQVEHGAKPVADHVLPATQGGLATHVSVVLVHTKAGALQAQLVWPVSELPVLYSDVVGHARQLTSPVTEKVCAGHTWHTALLVALHAEA